MTSAGLFPQGELRKYRNFNRGTLAELGDVLTPLAGDPSVDAWLGVAKVPRKVPADVEWPKPKPTEGGLKKRGT